MRNLFFISGPQGAGKSTLLRMLHGPNFIIPELEESPIQLETNTVKLDASPETRQKLKICQKSLENFECYMLAQKHQDRIVIGNRCVIDNLAFNEVYFRRGWINEKQRVEIDNICRVLYAPIDELQNPYTIILNPGFEIVQAHLEERWKTKGKKWRESDSDYIRFACESYKSFRANPNVFYVDHEIDLYSSSDAESIMDWLTKKSGMQLQNPVLTNVN